MNKYSVFSISRVQVNKVNLEYIVISRRCIFRAGTRFNVRGVDLQGNVANFVETEQIVISSENVCSFVQVSLFFCFFHLKCRINILI